MCEDMLAPAGTQKAVVAKLHAEIARVVALADVRERFTATGLAPVGSTPEQLASRMREDRAKWARVIREVGFKFEQ